MLLFYSFLSFFFFLAYLYYIHLHNLLTYVLLIFSIFPIRFHFSLPSHSFIRNILIHFIILLIRSFSLAPLSINSSTLTTFKEHFTLIRSICYRISHSYHLSYGALHWYKFSLRINLRIHVSSVSLFNETRFQIRWFIETYEEFRLYLALEVKRFEIFAIFRKFPHEAAFL